MGGRTALPSERQGYAVLLGITRSVGLLVGPVITLALQWLFRPAIPDGGGSLLGAFAVPTTFLACVNTCAFIWLCVVWQEPPAAPRELPKQADKPRTLLSFLLQGKVCALIIVYFCCGLIAMGYEYLVPVVASKCLRWEDGRGGGAVLTAVAIAVLFNQLTLLRLKSHFQDRQLVLLGSTCMTAMIVLNIVLWFAAFGESLPSVAVELTSQRWLVVVTPFVLLELFYPWLVSSTIATWIRVTMADAPHRAGILQAIFTTFAAAGQTLAPVWDGWAFSDHRQHVDGLPWVAMAGLSAAVLVQFCCSLAAYRQLAPEDKDEKLLRDTQGSTLVSGSSGDV